MKQISIKEELELLFEEHVRLVDFIEYGYSLQDLVQETCPIPPEGARFDISFEGRLEGDKISGNVSGIDFLEVRPDGVFILNLRAHIHTDDGAMIQLKETGINSKGRLQLFMDFHSNDDRYRWLNNSRVLGLGHADFHTGVAKIKAYKL